MERITTKAAERINNLKVHINNGDKMGNAGTGTGTEIAEELIQAAYNENMDRINKIFSEAGPEEAKRLANMRDKNREPLLHIAIKKNRLHTFNALVDAGADLEMFNGPNQAAHLVAMYGRTEMAKVIIDKGIKPRQNLRSVWPSHFAAKYEHAGLERILEAWEQANNTSTNLNFLRTDQQQIARQQTGGKRSNTVHQRAKEKG
jgi:ankyrin repeat protein